MIPPIRCIGGVFTVFWRSQDNRNQHGLMWPYDGIPSTPFLDGVGDCLSYRPSRRSARLCRDSVDVC